MRDCRKTVFNKKKKVTTPQNLKKPHPILDIRRDGRRESDENESRMLCACVVAMLP